jgi:hypothetical protein
VQADELRAKAASEAEMRARAEEQAKRAEHEISELRRRVRGVEGVAGGE